MAPIAPRAMHAWRAIASELQWIAVMPTPAPSMCAMNQDAPTLQRRGIAMTETPVWPVKRANQAPAAAECPFPVTMETRVQRTPVTQTQAVPISPPLEPSARTEIHAPREVNASRANVSEEKPSANAKPTMSAPKVKTCVTHNPSATRRFSLLFAKWTRPLQ